MRVQAGDGGAAHRRARSRRGGAGAALRPCRRVADVGAARLPGRHRTGAADVRRPDPPPAECPLAERTSDPELTQTSPSEPRGRRHRRGGSDDRHRPAELIAPLLPEIERRTGASEGALGASSQPTPCRSSFSRSRWGAWRTRWGAGPADRGARAGRGGLWGDRGIGVHLAAGARPGHPGGRIGGELDRGARPRLRSRATRPEGEAIGVTSWCDQCRFARGASTRGGHCRPDLVLRPLSDRRRDLGRHRGRGHLPSASRTTHGVADTRPGRRSGARLDQGPARWRWA